MPTRSSSAPERGGASPVREVQALVEGVDPHGHDAATLEALARRIAELLGHPVSGAGPSRRVPDTTYFVPQQTLDLARARALGIAGASDLFGGVVPHDFVATKLVSHPVLDEAAGVPAGWCPRLGKRLAKAVLPGLTVFSARDARRAYRALRPLGPLRLKLAHGIGGCGQFLLEHPDDLDAVLASTAGSGIASTGASLELHLYAPVTWSVGWVECGPWRASYVGSQRSTRNRQGDEVYGGSDLMLVRGGVERLDVLPLEPAVGEGVRFARSYHAAIVDSYPGFFASRCNYDVIHGHDQDGVARTGVLEQSWRIGGASPAEIAALAAFASDPSVELVHASSHEVYGPCRPPPDADVHYRGVDPRAGEMTKYSVLARHGH